MRKFFLDLITVIIGLPMLVAWFWPNLPDLTKVQVNITNEVFNYGLLKQIIWSASVQMIGAFIITPISELGRKTGYMALASIITTPLTLAPKLFGIEVLTYIVITDAVRASSLPAEYLLPIYMAGCWAGTLLPPVIMSTITMGMSAWKGIFRKSMS